MASVSSIAPTPRAISAPRAVASLHTTQCSPTLSNSIRVTSPSRRVAGRMSMRWSTECPLSRGIFAWPTLVIILRPRLEFRRHARQNAPQLEQRLAQMDASIVEPDLADGFLMRPGTLLHDGDRLFEPAIVLEIAKHHDRVGEVARVHRRTHCSS